jgi:hypothetical protein
MYHLITEEWQGSPINFRQEDAWVNLTEMCGAFGKRPVDFLRLPSTNDYLAALAAELGLLCENLTTTDKARGRAGTWAHPDLAIECARWLSPALSIRCNRIIRRLLAGETIKGAPLTPAQRRLRKQRLKLHGSELRVEIDGVRRQLDAMREAEDLPGHVAVREWLAEQCLTLAHGDLSRLCIRLAAEARRGAITSGEKSVAVNTKARVQRVNTYAPEAIAAAHAALFPALLIQG